MWLCVVIFFFSSRRRHTRCALVTGVQTCALPILQDNAFCASALGPDGTRAMRAAYEFSDWSISYETSGTYVTRELFDVRASANDVIFHWPQSCSDLTRYSDSSGGPGRKSVKHIVAGEIWDSRRSRKLPQIGRAHV